jgi:nucleotide-binding universal stress UspA family protein
MSATGSPPIAVDGSETARRHASCPVMVVRTEKEK